MRQCNAIVVWKPSFIVETPQYFFEYSGEKKHKIFKRSKTMQVEYLL